MRKPVIAAMVLFIIFVGAFIWIDLPTYSGVKAHEFEIMPGEPAIAIANRLKHAKLIRNARFFAVLSRVSHNSQKLQKGLYLLSDNMSALEILSFIAHGKVYMVHVTIPEGYSIKQIARLLATKKLIPAARTFSDYALGGNDLGKRFSFIKKKSIEGYLFPNTYDFPKNISVERIAITMVRQFSNSVYSKYKDAVKDSGRDLSTTIILASIVEKEARVSAERPMVAQVYLKRLKRNMFLGSCPTVAYAVNKFDGQHLSYADLKVDSPYNTYINQGLPPTPVCSPGKAAIDAVLHPADTDYLYFVSKNDGTHKFSKTLKEHNAAVNLYQKKLNVGQQQ